MGLDKLDGVRRHAAVAQSGANGLNLPCGLGRIDGVAPAVAGCAHSPEHGIDPVIVPAGIAQPLQHDHAQPFAEDGAVAVAVEGTCIAGRRQGRRLAEAHVHEDVVERIDAAGENEVGTTCLQLQRREVDGAERAGAGRIDDAIGPAEVEAIGDPPGDDVSEQTGKGVLLPIDVILPDTANDILRRFRGNTRIGKGAPPDRMTQPGAQWDDQFQCPRHAEDAADAFAVDAVGLVAGILQRGLGDHEPEKLSRIGGFEIVGSDAELGRGKGDCLEKAAAPM